MSVSREKRPLIRKIIPQSYNKGELFCVGLQAGHFCHTLRLTKNFTTIIQKSDCNSGP